MILCFWRACLPSSGDLFEGERQLRLHLKQRKQEHQDLLKKSETLQKDTEASAEAATEAKKPSQAAAELLRAQLEESRSVLIDSYYAMAIVQSRKSDTEMAMKLYRKCLKLNPEHMNALLGLASELQQIGTPEDDAKAEKLVK